jgi:hypothetical protein
MHFVPSFLTAENPLSSPWWAEPERSPFVADATDRDDRRSKALVNAAKFAAARPRIAILAQQLNRGPQLFENTALFFTFLCAHRIGRGHMSTGSLVGFRQSGDCLNFFDDTKEKIRGLAPRLCILRYRRDRRPPMGLIASPIVSRQLSFEPNRVRQH